MHRESNFWKRTVTPADAGENERSGPTGVSRGGDQQSGETLWTTLQDLPGNRYPQDIALSPTGTVAVALAPIRDSTILIVVAPIPTPATWSLIVLVILMADAGIGCTRSS